MSDHKERISELFRQGSFPSDSSRCAHDLLGNKKILLYGAGGGFIYSSAVILKRYGFKAYAVLDRKFKTGASLFGIPVFSPFEYRPSDEEKESAAAVITVMRSEYHQEIFGCLRGLGFKNVMLASDIYEYHLPHPVPELEEKGFKYYLDNERRITECLGFFSDDLSREIFTRVIETHMTRRPVPIPESPAEEQYFPKDISMGKGCSRFINCGAYNGDTVMRLNILFGKVDAVACFEPSPGNFESLARYLCARHNEIAQDVIAFPCGVYSGGIQLRFEADNESNSMISDKGESVIQCVALDNAIPGFRPTFISMDVEGVELEALEGAEKLIRESRPDLAVCVYHSPNHIWDIPLYIKSLQLGYKFYLRNYSSFISETVLYAST